ncbi:aftiphilin-like [Uloborus diversus]|uniref:aftiphilin-like n=1 Tax=Uloborus diversus TaxID=327109 RepID=UPI00240A6D1D|nr:aftiphilin-like [Uloborus diversus]
MASNVFPMLSSSPPPMEDCPDDEDDDDDFGDFASTNIPFDSSFDSPVASEKFKCFKTGDNGVNDINLKSDLKEFQIFDETESNSCKLPHDFSQRIRNSESDTSPSENFCDYPLSERNKCYPNHEKNEPVYLSERKPVTSQNSALQTNHCEKFEKLSKKEDFSDELVINNCSHTETLSESEKLECFSISQKSCDTESNVLKTANSFNCSNSVDLSHRCDKIDKNETSNSPPHKSVSNLCSSEAHCINVKLCNNFESLSLHSRSNSISSNNSEDFNNFQQSESDLNISHNPVTSIADASFSNFSNTANSEIFTPNFDEFHENEDTQDASEGSLENFQVYESNHFSEKYVSVSKELNDGSEHDEFQGFQNCAGDTGTESEGFAEFQDFKDNQCPEQDDFAEFESASFEQSKTLEHEESCEFADFEAVSFQDDKSAEELESCKFANFECATFCPGPERRDSTSSIPPSVAQPQDKNIDKLSTVINVIFPLATEDETVSNESFSEILEQSNKSHRLWEKLHEVEPTPSARFQWGVSQSFQQLLRSVNVDYHSILRTSSVPIFASGLSLLEPVKGLSNSANQEPEDRNQSPRDPIPPVEFDWNSSGLVNPLDSGQAALTLMDLSFLSSAETHTSVSSGDHSFENEFLKPNPTLSQCDNGSKDQILEQLLSKNVCSLPTSQASHRPCDLSKEAIHVLDQLPDLSFMLAKVLMFPISSNT